MKRKNTRRFDPRYFMDEKTEKSKVLKEMQIGAHPTASQDPAWSSSNPRKLKPAEKLELLHRQLETAYRNPGAVPAILQQIDDLLGEHPELMRESKEEGPEPDWINPLEQTVDMHDVAILHKMLANFFQKHNQLPSEDQLQDLMSNARKRADKSRATHGQSESDPHWHFDRR